MTNDKGLAVFLVGWIGGFYGGVLLLAIALLRGADRAAMGAGTAAAVRGAAPFASELGRVGAPVQVLALAVAFTGIAMAAVTGDAQRAS